MNLYLIRHAEAVPLGTDRVEVDEDRPLSAEGVRQVEHLAGGLKRLGIPLEKIATSPLRRAQQTAAGLLQHLQLPASALVVCEELAPGRPSKRLAKFLHTLGSEHVALVGHQPDMSEHAAWLIGSRKARLKFATAGAACIVCDSAPGKGTGTLLWLVIPEIFK